MRKFYIENEFNQRFSLWGNRVYMVDPSGLGIKHESSYIRIGNSFLRNKRHIAQSEIAGTIEFLDPGANKRFNEFYDFCAAASSLHLVYDSGDGTEYIRDIDIAEIGKTERTGATLPISVTFLCKTLYYLRANNRFTFEPSDNEKRYDYKYDFTYGGYGSYETIFQNNGHAEAPFDCTIYGYCSNPTIRIIYGDAILYEVTFPVAVENGEYIRYSSRDGMLEATLVTAEGETNLMPLLDIQQDNFFKLPVGNSKIAFTSDGASTNLVTMTVFKMYEVV
jgi:hypothetical protein